MKKSVLSLFAFSALALASSAFATQTATITINGSLTSQDSSASVKARACASGSTLANCISSIDTAYGAGNSVSLGNLADEGDSRKRFIQFEASLQFIAFKNDYIKLISYMDTNGTTFNGSPMTNGSSSLIQYRLKYLKLVSVGSGSFGQTKLGASGAPSLPAVIVNNSSDSNLLLTHTAGDTVWDQSSAAGYGVNDKVVMAANSSSALIVRGIIEVDYSENATSDSFEGAINFGVQAMNP